jgi:hypothetical protein
VAFIGHANIADLIVEWSVAPRLPDALCREHVQEFDDAAQDARKAPPALRICAQCVELSKCRSWVNALPKDRRPDGVVGGQVVTKRRVNRTAAGRVWGTQRKEPS